MAGSDWTPIIVAIVGLVGSLSGVGVGLVGAAMLDSRRRATEERARRAARDDVLQDQRNSLELELLREVKSIARRQSEAMTTVVTQLVSRPRMFATGAIQEVIAFAGELVTLATRVADANLAEAIVKANAACVACYLGPRDGMEERLSDAHVALADVASDAGELYRSVLGQPVDSLHREG